MRYEERTVLEAFRIYSELSIKGVASLKAFSSYLIDEQIRGLVDLYAFEVDCTIISSGEWVYLIPRAMASPFHISNEKFKEKYLSGKSTVQDIYVMYFAIIIFYGKFYDSYSTIEPVLDFVSMDTWLESVNQNIQKLEELDEQTLKYLEDDFNYNWLGIINNWRLLDDVNESASVQDARTKSRLSLLNQTRDFLIKEGLARDIGNFELELTEKSRAIIGHYFMETEFNRGILELLYKESV